MTVGGYAIFEIPSDKTAEELATSFGLTMAQCAEFDAADFDPACLSFQYCFTLVDNQPEPNGAAFSLPEAKVQATVLTKSNFATEEQTATTGYSANQLASQSSLAELDRLPEIQVVLDAVNVLATELSANLAAIDSASDIETVYNIVQQPSGVINTGRGAGLGPEDLNLSYFVSLTDMPGYTQADLELYVPGTDTVIPYNPELPAPYTFDSNGDCFNTNDYRLVIRYAGGGAVLSTITVPEGDNVNVPWTYNPVIPALSGGSSSQR